MRSLAASVCVLTLVSARGAVAQSSVPAPRDAAGADGLMVDVERIVDAEERGGWFTDEPRYAAVQPALLESLCRATPAARDEAAARLRRARAAEGDPRGLFEGAGRKVTAAVERALSAERRDEAFAKARAHEHDCPFWVTPKRDFAGRQTDRKRFTLNLESGGLLQIRETAGTLTYGGGGVIRVLGGRGFGPVSLLAGGEFAGGAMIVPGQSPSRFVVNYFPAVPVMVRFWSGAWHYDAELAFVSLFQADNGSFSYGGRAGFSLGVMTLRTRNILPWAGAAFAMEHYVASGGRPQADFFRGGLRVGAIWDP